MSGEPTLHAVVFGSIGNRYNRTKISWLPTDDMYRLCRMTTRDCGLMLRGLNWQWQAKLMFHTATGNLCPMCVSRFMLVLLHLRGCPRCEYVMFDDWAANAAEEDKLNFQQNDK